MLRVLLDVVVTSRGDRANLEAEVLALRRQVQVLERQIKRVQWSPGDRMVMSALRDRLPQSAWAGLLVRPETVLGWHRALVRRKWASYRGRPRRGRPPILAECRGLIVRMAKENPGWGYFRIRGELLKLGHTIGATTIRSVLVAAGVSPAPRRAGMSWKQCVRSREAPSTESRSVGLPRELLVTVVNHGAQLEQDAARRQVHIDKGVEALEENCVDAEEIGSHQRLCWSLPVVERKTLDNLANSLSDGGLAFQLQRLAETARAAIVVEGDYPDLFRTQPGRGSWLADLLGRLAVRYPEVPIVFAGSRRFAEEWAYRFLAAAVADRTGVHGFREDALNPGTGLVP